jgi:hypothetical protein
LKPANIFLTRSGGGSTSSPHAKLLDFGLAKPAGSPIAISTSRIATTPPSLTAKGTIVGTFQYMAPEQLEGQPADSRSDIFALGAVVYEMVTGRKAFEGESHASLIGAILKDEPPGLDQSQPLAPPHLDHVVRRCLAKDPDARWQSASDVARELGWISETSDSAATSAPYSGRRFDLRRIGWPVAAAVAALIVLIATIAAWVYRSRPSPDTGVYRASLTLPPDVRLAGVPPAERLAISPDGRQLAYVVREADSTVRLWLRALDSTSGRPLAGTEGAWGPFWSPDSRSVAFFTSTDHKLKRIEAGSGTLVTVYDLGTVLPPGLGGSWNSDGVILFSHEDGKGIQRVPSSGGAVSSVTTLDAAAGETRHVEPYFLPDGHHFLYLALGSREGGPNDANGLYVASLDSAERKLLMAHGSNAKFARGYLLFMREQALMAQPFDLSSMELRSEALPVGQPVRIGGGFGGPFSTTGGFTVSQQHVIVYNGGGADPQSQLLWFDRSGRQLDMLGDRGSYGGVELSPDGARAAVTTTNVRNGNDIWIFDVKRGLRTRVTLEGGDREGQIWSPDGNRIVYRTGFDVREKEIGGAAGERAVHGLLLQDTVVLVGRWAFHSVSVARRASQRRRPLGAAARGRCEAVSLHADAAARVSGTILARWALDRVCLERIAPERGERCALFRSGCEVADLQRRWRGSSLAARRQRAVFCRGRRHDHGCAGERRQYGVHGWCDHAAVQDADARRPVHVRRHG